MILRRTAILLIPSFFLLLLVLGVCLSTSYDDQQFSYLAQAFLHGHLNFLHPYQVSADDIVYFKHHLYWALGPFPAVALMPFVLVFDIFHGFFLQSYLQCALVLAVFGTVFSIARNFAYDVEDSLVLSMGFVLGTAFIGVAAISFSWYFAQAVTVLLSLGLVRILQPKTVVALGSICAALLLTRVDAALIVVFFGLEILRNKVRTDKKRKQLLELFVPLGAASIILGTYNFLRFGNFLNQGYAAQNLYPVIASERAHGLINLGHIPTNFYYAFINGPIASFRPGTHDLIFPYIQNDPWGMSIFLTSPYLLYLFALKRRELKGWPLNLLIAAGLMIIFLLAWFATGYFQFGWRFSLDFMPLLFVLFMAKYKQRNKRLSLGMKTLLLGSGVLNFYLMLSTILLKAHMGFLGL